MRQVTDAAAHGGQVNRVTKLNAVVVRNGGGGSAAASAEQTAPIVQGGPREPQDEDRSAADPDQANGR